MGFKIKGVSR